ncbi:PVC-type heme-binding CxxCH protein [Chitinophaga sp. MM2321]|uniref:PVC-type heme-binding CxxCH protein n=1 Tax=Chitinophaga sp. MM2321 TaxID=3137178 RepID=UPI0032D576E9
MKKNSRNILQGCLPGICFIFLMAAGCNNRPAYQPTQAVKEALSSFTLAPGFKIELLVSEPLVNDPVDMTIDEDGRLYVVEMTGVPHNKSRIGKILQLLDTDGDAVMDKSVVFADSLVLPSGITRWKKGMIVTDPPNVYYMEDTDGDGIADIKEIMLTGFDTSNIEANVNNPEYGLDNWVYLSSLPVIKGGNIHYASDSTSSILEESTIRFRPDRHLIEPMSGTSQFGLSFDAWGNHLLVNSGNHLYQEIIAYRYLHRNPNLTASGATQTLAHHPEVFPITKNPEYQMLTDIGVFTSACGITAYLGGAFPKEYNNNDITFVAEPASNIIHADRLKDSGVSFIAKRVSERKEFLASTDPYSRMVNMYVGPDGALYVIDMYRQIIEGPEFMSEEMLKKVDLYNGNTIGRIYRISATDAPAADWTKGLHLGKASEKELVEKLKDKNSWWRMNAQRLLVDRNDDKAIPALTSLASDPTSPLGRLHALWTLEGMNKLAAPIILEALKDPEPGVRQNAIQLAELHMSADAVLIPALLAMQNDANEKVRFQLLCTLGSVNSPLAAEVRQKLLFRDISNNWMQIAALSAESSQTNVLLDSMLAKFDPSVIAYGSMVKLLGGIMAKTQGVEAVKQLIQKTLSDPSKEKKGWQAPLLAGLYTGLATRMPFPEQLTSERNLLIGAALDHPSGLIRNSSVNILKLMGLPATPATATAMLKARGKALDKSLDQDTRADAIAFLKIRNPKQYATELKQLLTPQSPMEVQLAAVKALGEIPGEEICKYLLDQWNAFTPAIRNEAINTFIGNPGRVKLLLDKVEAGEINRGSFSWSQSVQLRGSGEQMKRARTLLTDSDNKRKAVIEQYQDALTLKADIANGKKMFLANCSYCHQLGKKDGRPFGPDLGTVYAWPVSDILTNILDPNKSIAHGFDLWIAKLNNGKSIQGIITAESPTAITISNADGEVSNIARQDISSLTALGMSAMPTDFEKKIDKQQMADLLAFLKQLG